MRTVSQEEIQRIEKLIPKFYYALLSDVDRRAGERTSPDITDECGIALALWVMAGAAAAPPDEISEFMRGAQRLGFSSAELMDLIANLGDHIASEHSEYLPLFRAAVREPHIQSLAEQLRSYAREFHLFDVVSSIDRD